MRSKVERPGIIHLTSLRPTSLAVISIQGLTMAASPRISISVITGAHFLSACTGDAGYLLQLLEGRHAALRKQLSHPGFHWEKALLAIPELSR